MSHLNGIIVVDESDNSVAGSLCVGNIPRRKQMFKDLGNALAERRRETLN